MKADADLVQFKLRMRESLRAQIESAAVATGESMNSEIVRRLERSFQSDFATASAKLGIMLQAIAYDVIRLEQITGKPFTEHRPSTIALAQIVEQSVRAMGAPTPNAIEISDIADKIEAIGKEAEQKMAFLIEMGAAYKGNALNAFAAYLVPRVEFAGARNLLTAKSITATVDLAKEPKDWEGISESDAARINKALLELGALDEQRKGLFDEFSKLYKAEEDAKAQARVLVSVVNADPQVINAEAQNGPAV